MSERRGANQRKSRSMRVARAVTRSLPGQGRRGLARAASDSAGWAVAVGEKWRPQRHTHGICGFLGLPINSPTGSPTDSGLTGTPQRPQGASVPTGSGRRRPQRGHDLCSKQLAWCRQIDTLTGLFRQGSPRLWRPSPLKKICHCSVAVTFSTARANSSTQPHPPRPALP